MGFNGSQWRDARFWNGSQWQEYIPPTYSVPKATSFDTADGWQDSNGIIAVSGSQGHVNRMNQPWMYGPGDGWYGKLPDQNRPIRIAFTYALEVLGGSSAYLEYEFGVWGLGAVNETFQTGVGSRNWSTYYTQPNYSIGESGGFYGGLQAYIGVQSENYIFDDVNMTLHVDHVSLEYSDGSPVLSLGNVPWQPYVWNGSQWI